MSKRSIRFVSAGACALLAACQSGARSEPPRAAVAVAPAAAAAPASTTLPPAPGTPPAVSGTPPPVPERAAAQFADAVASMKAGRATDAELDFKQLTVAYPDFAGPNVNLGLLYLRGGRLGEAEAAFQKALELAPNDAVAADELGIVERRLGKFAAAEAAYQRAIAADSAYAAAHLNLGVLYDLYLDQPKKALDQYERYLALAGENKQVSGWLVEVRKRAGVAAPAAKPGDVGNAAVGAAVPKQEPST